VQQNGDTHKHLKALRAPAIARAKLKRGLPLFIRCLIGTGRRKTIHRQRRAKTSLSKRFGFSISAMRVETLELL
jgi:hypothetical protein